MLSVFTEYNAIKGAIAELIETSGYKNDYLAKKVGLTQANFSVKKQRNSWTDREVEKIIRVLTSVNEDVEDMLMLKIAKAREDEEIISFDEYKKLVSSWK